MADRRHIEDRRGVAVDDATVASSNGSRVRLEHLGFESLVNLRGDASEERFRTAVQETTGVELPLEPNTFRQADGRSILWLGPDEWLVAGPDGEAGAIASRLREMLADDPWLSVVDLSHNFTGFALRGPAAGDVLAKGCPLDLHPSVFTAGRSAQSVVAHARVLLAGTPDGFDIRVRNSFAAYLAAWLTDAMREFGD